MPAAPVDGAGRQGHGSTTEAKGKSVSQLEEKDRGCACDGAAAQQQQQVASQLGVEQQGRMEIELDGLQGEQMALADIPEAQNLSLRRSKRRAGSNGEDSMELAMKRKAGVSDADLPTKGEQMCLSFLQYSDNLIAGSFGDLGITLGTDIPSVKESVALIKSVEENRLAHQPATDKLVDIFDKEEKCLQEEEEVDVFILNHLCGKIMDEAMDSSGDLHDRTAVLPNNKSSSSKKKKANSTGRGKNKNKSI